MAYQPKHFLIIGNGKSVDDIRSFQSTAAYHAAFEGLDDSFKQAHKVVTVSQESDLGAFSATELLAILNKVRAGQKPIKVLHSKTESLPRVWAALTSQTDPEDKETEAPTETQTETPASETAPDAPAPEPTSDAPADDATAPQTEDTDMAKKATAKKTTSKTKSAPKPRAPRADRTPGEGKPVRAGTSLAKILGFAIKGDKTVDQIARALELRPDQIRHRCLQVLYTNNGVEIAIDKDSGKVKVAKFPKGFGPATIIKEKAE